MRRGTACDDENHRRWYVYMTECKRDYFVLLY